MRKYISICGVGKRMAGTGKNSGKPYDFTPVAFTYEDDYMNGLKAVTSNIDAGSLGNYVPAVGDSVEVVMHEDFRTGRVYVDAVL